MDFSLWLPKVSDLAQDSRTEDSSWSSSYCFIVFPSLPSNVNWVQHLRLLQKLSNFPNKGLLQILPLFPVPVQVPADKDDKCRLYFPFFIGLSIIIGSKQRRILTISNDFSTEMFFFPVGLAIEEDDFDVRPHEGPTADYFSISGKGWSVVNLVGLPRGTGHHDIVAFVVFFIIGPNEALPLYLLDRLYFHSQLNSSAFLLNFSCQKLAKVLGAQFGLFLLQSVSRIDEVIEAFVLIGIPKKEKEAHFTRISSKDSSTGDFKQQLQPIVTYIFINPSLKRDRVPIIAKLAIFGIQSGNLFGHCVDFPDVELKLNEPPNAEVAWDVRFIGKPFVLNFYYFCSCMVKINQLVS